jgi:hypothetical protein
MFLIEQHFENFTDELNTNSTIGGHFLLVPVPYNRHIYLWAYMKDFRAHGSLYPAFLTIELQAYFLRAVAAFLDQHKNS